MSSTTQSLQVALQEITGAGHVRVATEADAVMGVQPRVVVEPGTEEEVAALLRFADTRGLAVLPRGGGTHLATGGIPRAGDIVLSLARLNAIVEHTPADQTITVQAGLRLADLQAALARARQELALDPPLTPGATIGGLLATNVSGPRRLRFGGVRDQLLGIRVVLPDGTVAKGGGKVVKNVAGYDLAKLYTGALGTLGVVVAASFRLYPLAVASRTIVVEAASSEPLCALVLHILASTLVPSALDVLGATTDTTAHTLAVRFESSVADAVDEQVAAILDMASGAEFTGRTALHRTVLQGESEAAFWRDTQALSLATGATDDTCTLKVSLLPSEISGWLDDVTAGARTAELQATWAAHTGHGLVNVRLAGSLDALVDAIPPLRAAAAQRRGTLVVTEAPPALAARGDVWGPVPALEVMRRLKWQFDPHDTLNPGRFAGGI